MLGQTTKSMLGIGQCTLKTHGRSWVCGGEMQEEVREGREEPGEAVPRSPRVEKRWLAVANDAEVKRLG